MRHRPCIIYRNGSPYLRFDEDTIVRLDADDAPFLLIELATWLCQENLIVGVSATMEATAKAFEALGSPGVSQEIMAAVNEILAKHNPSNTA
jgi:hypothetical protein